MTGLVETNVYVKSTVKTTYQIIQMQIFTNLTLCSGCGALQNKDLNVAVISTSTVGCCHHPPLHQVGHCCHCHICE